MKYNELIETINNESRPLDDFLMWCLCHIEGRAENPFERIDKFKKEDPDVHLLIGNEKFDFIYVIKELHNQYKRMLHNRAAEMVKDDFANLLTPLENIVEDAKYKVNQVIANWFKEKTGIEYDYE